MSTPRRPSRLAEYSANGSFYPRELTELGGILYFIDDNGVATPVNEIEHKVVDSGDNVIGTFTNKIKSITIPDATAGNFGLVKLSDDNAKPAGTAASGTSALVARADHVHPAQTSVSGNAGSASKLQTARTITFTGGVSGSGSFDGSKNISIDLALQGLSAVAKSGNYSDLTGAPAASDTAPSAAADTAKAGELTTYARADHVHPVQTSVSGNAGTATKLANARTFTLSGGATGSTSFDGSKDVTLNVEKIDASKIDGVLDIANIPQGALERLVPVANETARLALTTSDVQNGDVVKEQDTGLMYYVVDDTKLGTASKADAFEAFTAGSASVVPWTGITGKPDFATVATSGSYKDLLDLPTIPTIPNLSLSATGAGNVLTGMSVNGHKITVTKNITALTAHPDVTKSTDSTSTGSPAHGGTFTAVDNVTRDKFGHVTKINTKTVTLPSETGLSVDDEEEGNFISGIAVDGHKITLSRGTALTSHQTIPDVTVEATGTGNALTGATAAAHKITFTKGTFLTAHPSVNKTADPSDPTTQTTLSHGGTFIIQSAVTRDDYGHVTAWAKKKYQLPSETKLGLGTQSGSGNVVTGISVSNHTITVTKGITALTSETALSKESDDTTGNFVTDIAVDGHKITVSKGNAITSETKLSLGTQSGSGNVVTGISVNGHQITVTKGITALTSHQSIPDVTVDVPTTGNALTGATASGHAITFTKGTFLTAHPTISKSTDDTATSAPAFGGTFTAISGVTRDGNGHVTKVTTKTVTIPSIVNASNGIGYGTCTTAAATTAKVATLSNYVLKVNGVVAIGFTYDVPASATLNINSQGAKSIYYNNTAIVAGVIKAGDTATFVYNGSYYMLLAVDKTTITNSGSGNVVTGITATGNKLTVTKGITALTAHPDVTKSTDSTSTSSPGFGGTFTAVDSVTRDNYGHVTKINTKTVTLPSQTTLSKSTSGSGEMLKDLSVSGHTITVSKGNPSTTYTAAIGTTWTGSEAPYTQTITVSGMAATDNPIVDVVLDSDYDTATTELEEYAKIYKITTAANSITVYATDKTENAINIQLKVVK